jgi:hypothetical protein
MLPGIWAEATKELGIASNELESAVDYLGKITQENSRTTIQTV